jgi:non-specific serine/threonine protein kinase
MPSSQTGSAAIPNNLPFQLTSFIGREGESAKVRRLLATTRLLTLTGAGGVGKSRLAQRVAEGVMADYVDGVWLVELAPLADPTLVPRAVAATPDLREARGLAPADALIDFLGDRTILLVLDNCEHLVEAAAGLAVGLLRGCPGLRILTTSREPLRIGGETVWRVPSLALPDPYLPPSPDEIGRSEAVSLFVERARAHLPDFGLTAENAPAVVEICNRLDGLPLALELAAARIGVLAPAQIAQRLDDRFRLLTGGGRASLPRQQTLAASIAWSYDLLSEPEQRFFCRLSVFAGGWTLEAAEAIGGADALDLLTRLVGKSLVVAEPGAEVRYRLLETLRQFAAERLREDPEAEHATRRRHAEYFLALAEAAETEWHGPHHGTWLRRTALELDNLRAAFAQLAGDEDGPAALRLANALAFFGTLDRNRGEIRDWLERALAMPAAEECTTERAKGSTNAGWLAAFLGDYAAARRRLDQALTCARALGDEAREGEALGFLAMLASFQGDLEAQYVLGERALALARKVGDRWGMARTTDGLALLEAERGGLVAAIERLEVSLRLSEEAGDTLGAALTRNSLGDLVRRMGDYARAESLYSKTLAELGTLGLGNSYPGLIHNLGCLAYYRGDNRKAAALFEESLEAFRAMSDWRGVAECLAGLASVAAGEGDDARAAQLFGAAAALLEGMGAVAVDVNRAERERDEATVRARLGEKAFARAKDAGRALSLRRAIAVATERPPSPAEAAPTAGEVRPAVDPLTPREREVAALVARGLSNRQIAAELVISERTAANHVAHILDKLGLPSRAHLAARAAEFGV